jgi:hypothetical protein
MKKCPRCKKDFEPKRKDQKFCSTKCRTQFNSHRRYNLIKNDPTFKAKAKKRWGRWVKDHKEEFNAKMRIYMRKLHVKEKQKERYQKRKEYLKEYNRTHKTEINQLKKNWRQTEKGKKYCKEKEKTRKKRNRKEYFQKYYKEHSGSKHSPRTLTAKENSGANLRTCIQG